MARLNLIKVESQPEGPITVPLSPLTKANIPPLILGESDQLISNDDVNSLEEFCLQDKYREARRNFLRLELTEFITHHNIQLKAEEEPEEIIEKAIQLSENLILQHRLPTKLKAKAVLRLCLRKVLYFGYLKNFELDGIPKKRSRRVGPSEEEQQYRNNQLIAAQKTALNSIEIQGKVVELTKEMLHTGFVVEMFNRSGINTLSTQQVNDLIVNFMFWVLNTYPPFNDWHRIIVFLHIFKGLNKEAISKTIEEYGAKDKITYGLKPADIEKYYLEIEEIFQNMGNKFLISFLKKANLNDNSGEDVKKDGSKQDEKYLERTAYSLHMRDKSNIKLPKTAIEKCLSNRYIILAQRGNLTARTNFTLLMLRLISKPAYKTVLEKEHLSISDITQGVAMKIAEKVAMLDPRKKSLPRYLLNWSNILTTRQTIDEALVRIPVYATEAMQYIGKNPGCDNDTILAHCGVSSALLEKIKDNTVVGQQEAVYSDAPLNVDNSNGASVGDFLPELSSPSFIHALIDENKKKVLCGIWELLPPQHMALLQHALLSIEDPEYERDVHREIGIKIFLTHERVRKLLEEINNKLEADQAIERGDNKQESENEKNILNQELFIADEKAFLEWCEQKGITSEQKYWLELSLGLRKEVLFSKLRADKIVEFLSSKGHVGLKMSTIQRFLNKCKHSLESHLSYLLPDERFIKSVNIEESYALARKLLKSLAEEEDNLGDDFKLAIRQHLNQQAKAIKAERPYIN